MPIYDATRKTDPLPIADSILSKTITRAIISSALVRPMEVVDAARYARFVIDTYRKISDSDIKRQFAEALQMVEILIATPPMVGSAYDNDNSTAGVGEITKARIRAAIHLALHKLRLDGYSIAKTTDSKNHLPWKFPYITRIKNAFSVKQDGSGKKCLSIARMTDIAENLHASNMYNYALLRLYINAYLDSRVAREGAAFMGDNREDLADVPLCSRDNETIKRIINASPTTRSIFLYSVLLKKTGVEAIPDWGISLINEISQSHLNIDAIISGPVIPTNNGAKRGMPDTWLAWTYLIEIAINEDYINECPWPILVSLSKTPLEALEECQNNGQSSPWKEWLCRCKDQARTINPAEEVEGIIGRDFIHEVYAKLNTNSLIDLQSVVPSLVNTRSFAAQSTINPHALANDSDSNAGSAGNLIDILVGYSPDVVRMLKTLTAAYIVSDKLLIASGFPIDRKQPPQTREEGTKGKFEINALLLKIKIADNIAEKMNIYSWTMDDFLSFVEALESWLKGKASISEYFASWIISNVMKVLAGVSVRIRSLPDRRNRDSFHNTIQNIVDKYSETALFPYLPILLSSVDFLPKLEGDDDEKVKKAKKIKCIENEIWWYMEIGEIFGSPFNSKH